MFLYTVKMFLPNWLWAYQHLKNLFITAKNTRCQQLQIIMSRWKMGVGQMTVLICNGNLATQIHKSNAFDQSEGSWTPVGAYLILVLTSHER